MHVLFHCFVVFNSHVFHDFASTVGIHLDLLQCNFSLRFVVT